MTWWRRLRRLALTYTTRTFFFVFFFIIIVLLLYYLFRCRALEALAFQRVDHLVVSRWLFDQGQSLACLLAHPTRREDNGWKCRRHESVWSWEWWWDGWDWEERGFSAVSFARTCWSPKCGWNYFFFSSLNGMKMSSTTSCCSSIDKFREVLNEVLKKSSSPPLFLGRCTNVPTQSVCWGAGGDCCSVVIADFPVSFFLFSFSVVVFIFFFVFLSVCVGHCLPLPRQ